MLKSSVERGFKTKGTPTEERRAHARTGIAQIVYVNLLPANGGILLDVSSTGLGFQAADPIVHERQIRFRLSAEGIGDVELLGDLVWLDKTQKRGGLRFVDLSEDVRAQIQVWLDDRAAQSPAAPVSRLVAARKAFPSERDVAFPEPDRPFAREGGTSPSLPPDPAHVEPRMPAAMPAPPISQVPIRPAPPPRPRFGPPPSEPEQPDLEPRVAASPVRKVAHEHAPPIAAPRATHNRGFSYSPSPAVLGRDPWEDGSHSGSRLSPVALTIVVLLAVVGGVFVFLHKQQTGESLIRLGERLSGDDSAESAQRAASTPAAPLPNIPQALSKSAADTSQPALPDPREGPDAGGSPSAGVNLPSAPSNRPSGASESSSSAAPNETSPARDAGSQAELGASKSPEEQKNAASIAEPASRDVGASSQADDGHTEFELAQKYLRGWGVHEDQNAAVQLLWVAVGKGNSEAELELADLYLRGGRLKQNCEQARILLNAASNKGNPLASQKIAELSTYGCHL